MINFIVAAMLALAAGQTSETLKMSQMYSDGMVLQRETPLVIKGEAAAGERVTVQLEGPFKTVKKTVRTSSEGVWEVNLHLRRLL